MRISTLARRMQIKIRIWWRDISLEQINKHHPLKPSRALSYMMRNVRNKESFQLYHVSNNACSTYNDYVNATYDFLGTLPAFHGVGTRLDFIGEHLMERGEIDDTRVKDIPDHYLLVADDINQT